MGGGSENRSKDSYTISKYDPVNNSWHSPIQTPYCLFAMTTLNNNLLIAGGKDKNVRTNEVFTLDVTQLKSYTKMIIARSLATAVGHQGMLIITGGEDDKGNKISSTELFDSKNEQWFVCSDIPQPHSHLKPAIVDNILFLLGGLNENRSRNPSLAVFTAPLDTLSRYQLKWSTNQDAPVCRSAPVSVNGTHLLIVGGYNKSEANCTPTSDIYKLNKVNHSWEAIGNIPSARRSSAAVGTPDNRVIVIGGVNDQRRVTNTVWIGSCEPLN